MSTQWGYAFRVNDVQDRDTRFTDATATNPSLTEEVQTEVQDGKTLAFALLDEMALVKPYVVSVGGYRDADNGEANLIIHINEDRA